VVYYYATLYSIGSGYIYTLPIGYSDLVSISTMVLTRYIYMALLIEWVMLLVYRYEYIDWWVYGG